MRIDRKQDILKLVLGGVRIIVLFVIFYEQT